MTEGNIPSDPAGPRVLDPFDFHGHPTSIISGLGGDAPLPDPTYAFHTSYVPVARGHAHFTVRFDGLKAKRGTLWLRIHMLPGSPGATARMVTGQRIQLNWLSYHGGEVHLRFEAFRGATYAIMGLVSDECDASADTLTVTLDRPATEADLVEGATFAEAQTTGYASDTIRGAALMLSTDPALFTAPVCQPCTPAQVRDPAFRGWQKQLDATPRDPATAWQAAYVMQVLERYGLLQPGARGLAFGPQGSAIAGLLTTNGLACDTVGLSDAKGADQPEGSVHPEALPGDFFAYDLVLSIRATDTLTSERSAQAFLEKAMECLRPGGLAVHVVAHRLAGQETPATSFDRNGLEKVLLAMISRGHQAARLKPVFQHTRVEATPDGLIPFGIVTRRAALLL